MQRILIAGSSGSGKSTLARTLADRLRLPYVELDSLFHGPNWTPRPEFLADVQRIAAGDRWVSEWQYETARPVLLARADTLIWLDFGRRTVMYRVLRRSFRRAAFRQPIFNGNTEGFRDWLDPEHPIRWTWAHHDNTADRISELAGGPQLIRLASPRAVRCWLNSA
ncbi:MAG: adenylate kinase [Actinomycetota bacterium]|nr:adenylate kinase [Actinomycetota bacterium]MDQ2956718.1 adenylate kinase [Actinomycetota bacterium]